MTDTPSPSHQAPSSDPSELPRGRQSPSISSDRAIANERLASPLPTSPIHRRGPSDADPSQAAAADVNSGSQTPSDDPKNSRADEGPGSSALARALRAVGRRSSQQSFSAVETDERDPTDSSTDKPTPENFESIVPNTIRSRQLSGHESPATFENFDIVRRHLVDPSHMSPAAVEGGASGARSPARPADTAPEASDAPEGILNEEFSSLQMQGGDVHRQIYRRTEAEENAKSTRHQRSQSYHEPRRDTDDPEMDIESILEPQGFRRNHLIRNAPNSSGLKPQANGSPGAGSTPIGAQPNFLTRNFYEFLSLYGHFAGEDVDDDDDDESDSQYEDDEDPQDSRRSGQAGETSPLLKKRRSRKQKKQDNAPKKGATGTVFILLKAFVGTGVLFLPRAFLNGGLIFSCVTMFIIACFSYYCFLLLTTSRLALKGSYAEMGNMVYGPWLRLLINSSLVLSQMGFASAYIVFTAENLQAFIYAVSKDDLFIDIGLMILMQLIVFLPLALYRNLNSISYVVYIADIFIVLGLIYLYYFGIATLAQDGLSDVVFLNDQTWPLFIGTAVFTFEGIGLLIPIQDGMKAPQQLPKVLGLVMLIIATIFISMGGISYAAYGSQTKTVIILNLPQDNKFVNAVQFLYSLAILLSTPMQIFPAITIMEKGIFTKSGKYSERVKWYKNAFRFGVVMLSALIAWLGASDLDKFVSLVGCFACVPLVYIYPPLIHRRAVQQAQWSSYLDVGIICVGFVIMVYTTTLNLGSNFT